MPQCLVLRINSENKDKIETYLAFGATRFEACKPIATDALRLALTPNINQMRYALHLFQNGQPHQFAHIYVSVLGIIAIPGMMTGAILGGSSVQQAARLQMVIMFMISSSTALSSMITTIFALSVVVDKEHRIRTDKIDNRPHAIWRARNWLVVKIAEVIKRWWDKAVGGVRKKSLGNADDEREGLLG